jgi:ABC-2 type transport system ATP-binding protein
MNLKNSSIFANYLNSVYNIIVENLTKKFGHFTAVNNISFSIKKGEIFGFLGANGAGKTTAMKMMCGLLLPTSGFAKIGGYDLATQSKAIKKNIGYMSQRFSLYDDLTVYENMQLFGTIYKIEKTTLKQRIQNSLSELDMNAFANALVRSLPLGWKQRLAFATALLHQPQIVFLDEPTSGVDPIVRREFWELIYKTAATGVTIFVTTHYMDEAEYCERISIMAEGELKLIGTPNELKEKMGVQTIDDLFIKFVNR